MKIDIEEKLKGIQGQSVPMEQTFDSTTVRSCFAAPDPYTATLDITDNSAAARAKEIYVLLNLSQDLFAIEDRGGTGMDENALRDRFFHWGTEQPKDVTRYYGIGKASLGALAQNIQIWSTPETLEATWFIDLPNFEEDTISGKLQNPECLKFPCQSPVGSVIIKMTGLKSKIDIQKLEREISERYTPYIKSGRVKIFIGETEDSYRRIKAMELPMEAPKKINIRRDGKHIIGEIGIKKPGSAMRGGIWCYSGEVGRLIEKHEFFGLDKDPSIDANSMIGWLDENFVPFMPHKDSYKKGTPEFAELYEIMVKKLEPLRKLVEKKLEVPSDLEGIRTEMEGIFNDLLGEIFSYGQTKRKKKGGHAKNYKKTGRENQPRTPAEEEDEKNLRKRKGKVNIKFYAGANATQRYIFEEKREGICAVHINTEYPQMINTYSKEGEITAATKDYIVQTMAMAYYPKLYGSSKVCNEYINAMLAKVRVNPEYRQRKRIKEIIKLYKEGLTYGKIEDKLKCSTVTISKALKTAPELRVKRKILSEEDKLEIIELKRQGWSWKELQKKFQCSANPISKVLKKAKGGDIIECS